MLCQHLDAAAIDPFVRVAKGNHNTRDARLDQRHGTGAGLPCMRAGLKRDISGSALCRSTGPCQRLGLGMRSATPRRAADGDELSR